MKRLRKPLLIMFGTIAVLSVVLWFWLRPTGASAALLLVKPTVGDFYVQVTTTGELKAKKFVEIQGPPNAQAAEAYQMKISSLVSEGTVVKEGDIVAELDRSGITAKLTEVQLAVQKAEAQFTQARLDSSLNLSAARNDIRNLEYGLEENRLSFEQAAYEAPSIKRQAQISYEKAQRAFEEAKKNYQTKVQQAVAKMSEVGAELERVRNKMNVVMSVMQGFTIKAPAAGMVIYAKEWDGRKRVVGSQVNPWSPAVATLPDLTQMESITYVNEIDIRKISVGQYVRLSLDADPAKKLTGKITKVANIGEQRPNSDSKVFEVKIDVSEADTTLRPGMTTGNTILTATVKNVLSIPLECLHGENNMTVVYKQSGSTFVRQEVRVGAMNDNEVVIEQGLTAEDRLYLSVPAKAEGIKTIALPAVQKTGN